MGTSFYKNYVSVRMEKQSLLSKCNVYSLNQIGIDIRNAKLYLGNKFYKYSDYLEASVVAGNNAFLNQNTVSIYLQEAMPFLDGGNNFIYTKTNTENKLQIYGTILMDYNLPYWDNTFTKFNVNGNYWINNNKKYNIDSVDANCVDVSYTSGGAVIPLKLSGKVASRNQFLECAPARHLKNNSPQTPLVFQTTIQHLASSTYRHTVSKFPEVALNSDQREDPHPSLSRVWQDCHTPEYLFPHMHPRLPARYSTPPARARSVR